MDPGLALAIDAAATESASLVIAIVKKARKVARFKKKTKKMADEAQILHSLLNNHKMAIKSIETLRNFEACLQRIDQFVDSCKNYNLLDISLEVFFHQKFSSLRKDIIAAKEVFLLESVTEILAREDRLVQSLEASKNEAKKLDVSMQTAIVKLQQSVRSQEVTHKNAADFEIPDLGAIHWNSPDKAFGHFEYQGLGQLVCLKVPSSHGFQRNIDIYRGLQHGAYVQRYFGLALVEGELYAILERLDGLPTLAEACKAATLQNDRLSRLRAAFNLAKTVAWYHKAGLVIKSLSDRSIIFKTLDDGSVFPYVTGVQHIRQVVERTTSIAFDVRYEPPEYQISKEHSVQSDIWALGIIVWQCLSGGSPFGIDEPIEEGNPHASRIKELLVSRKTPGFFNEDIGTEEVSTIIMNCWSVETYLRPSAASVAEILLDELIREETATRTPKPSVDSNQAPLMGNSDLSEAQVQAMSAIKAARQLNEKSRTFVQSHQRINAGILNMLLNSEEQPGPVNSFLIGAIFYWNVYEYEDQGPATDQSLGLLNNAEEQRAITALTFLETAARAGYQDAYLEIFKAHALLSRKYLEQFQYDPRNS